MPSNKPPPSNEQPPTPASPWTRYWARGLCLLTFPLLWVGGLVTSTDAGMAVPDWPSTFGYNLFAYPWQTWLFGPWDLFIEHGHRLLASLVGLLTIGFAMLVWRSDNRKWLRWLSIAAVLLVCLQGVLGGVRVTENDRAIAMVHGCMGPLFFALTAVLVAATSRTWMEAGAANRRTHAPRNGAGMLLACTVLAYVQLTLGAQLRHVAEDASPWAFAGVVKLHLLVAAVLTGHVVVAVWRVLRAQECPPAIRRAAQALVVVLVIQLCLGGGAWLLKYGAPGWAVGALPATIGANVADGLTQTHIVTAHSACGSLIFGLAALATAFALRTTTPITSPTNPSTSPEGLAA